MPGLTAIALGLAGSGTIALIGWRARALATSGALASIAVGTAVFGFGGLDWAAVMIAFFVLSSALSRLGRKRKARMMTVVEKGDQRDAGQVVANGGVPALLALVSGFSIAPGVLFPAFLGAMAAVTADTWSTEIGALSRRAPRSITSGRRVAPGTSGGVTPLGLLAALAGGVLIGAVAWLFGRPVWSIGLGAAAGLIGSVVDSLFGATIQQAYFCPVCREETEQPIHRCGTATTRLRGWAFIDNDAVNLLTSITGALIGGVSVWLLG